MSGRPPQHRPMPESFREFMQQLDCPRMNRPQRILVGLVLLVFLVVAITATTGHIYEATSSLVRVLDDLGEGIVTLIVILMIAGLEVIGMNTTLMALAAGYLYGSYHENDTNATAIASIVTFAAVVCGCLIAFFLGKTVLSSWAKELNERNPTFEALDHVLIEQGVKVNLLLRLTIPDCIINYCMACSSCATFDFCFGMFAMLPWIIVHAWYGVTLEKLSSVKNAANSEEFIQLIVGLVAVTLLSFVLIYYTKKEIARMVRTAPSNQPHSAHIYSHGSHGSHGHNSSHTYVHHRPPADGLDSQEGVQIC